MLAFSYSLAEKISFSAELKRKTFCYLGALYFRFFDVCLAPKMIILVRTDSISALWITMDSKILQASGVDFG